MTTLANNPPASITEPHRSFPRALLMRAPKLLMRAVLFLCVGAIASVLLAWGLGIWADIDSATLTSSTIPQRGRMWEITVWSGTGAMRLHSLRQAQSWGGWQATGAPNSSMSGDSGNAWCPATADSQAEWLILDYPQPVIPKAVHIYENYFPGAVHRVTVFNEAGEEIEAWRGQDPTPKNTTAGISKIPLNATIKTQRIKLYIDSPKAPGWNEIDAVGLLDSTGAVQWACDVQESSSYANLSATAPPPLTVADVVPDWCPLAKPDKSPSNSSSSDDRIFEARGWPMLALWVQRPDKSTTVAPVPAAYLRGGLVSGRLISNPGTATLPPILPTHPIWGGLLFNTIFFAVILALAWWLLVKPRQLVLELRRMRSGCCIACGYQLDYEFRAGCPECGWRRNP